MHRKDKGIQTSNHKGQSSNHKAREQKKKGTKMNYNNSNKTIHGSNKHTSINNHFKCKWTDNSNKKTQSSCTDEKTRPIYTYAAHKRLTSALKWRGGKKVLGENGNPKKAEVAILRAEKIDFQTKTVIRNKEGINPRRKCNNYKYLRTQHRNT